MRVGENLLVDGGVCEPGAQLTLPEPVAPAVPAAIKALSDPTRVRIVQILAANGSVCACDLEEPLGLSQPTVSHHLRQLLKAGLVERDKRGTWAFYRVSSGALAGVATAIGALVPAGAGSASSA
ncbi:helix-turn-helix transcriptional regulator [uncultured Demequina sp.]|uniref:ArsR/SmtB family transcription factor n=1 Tax=uncultured Demequina sp. TaxID=693499 RepID=UPI0025ED6BC1|nr:metalloregulator ArsR/SmtB family transcription factor [uncultured Demequina sp.]